jgi:hypothetical protein
MMSRWVLPTPPPLPFNNYLSEFELPNVRKSGRPRGSLGATKKKFFLY